MKLLWALAASLAFAAVALAAPTHRHAASAPVVETNPVLVLAHQAQLDRLALERDQFAAVPTHADKVGTVFAISLGSQSNSSFLDYYQGGVIHMMIGIDPDGIDAHYHSIQIARRRLSSRDFVGQNAFGAKVQASLSDDEQSHITAIVFPRGDRPVTSYPNDPGIAAAFSHMADDPSFDHYYWEKSVEGPEAKSIFVGSKMVIEGEIAAFPDGKVTHCNVVTITPTYGAPNGGRNFNCFVATKVHRVAFIAGDGTVLKEWK